MRAYRPQFRKTVLLNSPLPQHVLFKNHNKFYRNQIGQKITPHKFKKTNHLKLDLITRTNHFMEAYNGKCWGFNDVILDQFLNPVYTYWKNYIGITGKLPAILGLTFGDYIRIYNLLGYTVYSSFLPDILWRAILPMSNIQWPQGKVLGTQKSFPGRLSRKNILEIRMNGKKIYIPKTSFWVGKPSTSRPLYSNVTNQVRGIAKNPVDHPNGGRANTKGSFKTPWGTYAKKNK